MTRPTTNNWCCKAKVLCLHILEETLVDLVTEILSAPCQRCLKMSTRPCIVTCREGRGCLEIALGPSVSMFYFHEWWFHLIGFHTVLISTFGKQIKSKWDIEWVMVLRSCGFYYEVLQSLILVYSQRQSAALRRSILGLWKQPVYLSLHIPFQTSTVIV